MWGDQYPPNELLADMALHRPVDLTHEVVDINFRILRLRASGDDIGGENATASSFLDEISQIGKVRDTFSHTYVHDMHFH